MGSEGNADCVRDPLMISYAAGDCDKICLSSGPSAVLIWSGGPILWVKQCERTPNAMLSSLVPS
jgi:hypothetical protein